MILGLHGKGQSGKDSTYQTITESRHTADLRVRRQAFGDAVKLSAVRALGYRGTDEQCLMIGHALRQPGWAIVIVEPTGEEHAISGREYIQFFGTEAHRDTFGTDFWVERMSFSSAPDELLVFSDVRFDNEARAVRDHGGEIWHILRSHSVLQEDKHDSEQPIHPDLIDRLITNDGDLALLRHTVETELSRLIWNP